MDLLNSSPRCVSAGKKKSALRNGGEKSAENGEKKNRIRINSGSSPGSASGRSSTSSLNALVQNNGKAKQPSDPIRKVSINTQPMTISGDSPRRPISPTGLKQANSVNNVSENGAQMPNLANSAHRTSLLHISAEKRARKVRFFINNDKFFKGSTIAVSSEKFRTFGKLLEHLTKIMCNQVTLPNGVRYIFGLDGKSISDVVDLSHEGNYVCSSNANFKKMDYVKLAQEQDGNQWNRIKRDSYYLGMGSSKLFPSGPMRRDAYKQSGHSKSFGVNKLEEENNSGAIPNNFKPKIIAVLRSGRRPRRAARVLLNHRNAKTFDGVLAELTQLVKLDAGAVRKVFALSGKPVLDVGDFVDEEVFVAYGGEKWSSEDFELDYFEFKNVQSILKSPELDAKYEKFAAQLASSNSPKTNRKKLGRLPMKNGAIKPRKPSKSRGEDSPRVGYGVNGEGSVLYGQSISHGVPSEVTSKYLVGDIVGDGNFAVVRKCFSKKCKTEFALKIIDKAKCAGKEHMIESEVSILSLVAHQNIIELIEVFDFPSEKYLVTEYVKGGDLFDAIAADTKYTESVSRGMIRDLTSALKYLHDKMIVHRDIKPENLLVVDYPSQGLKSLKLGDFGLAQVVSEPLFTVCGTPTYVAPEILSETGYGVKVDVWATGVIMYILLVGFPPFSSRTNNQEELFDQILSGLFEFNSPDWDDISYPAKELISWMLQVDPLQRYSAYEILQHPWILNKDKD